MKTLGKRINEKMKECGGKSKLKEQNQIISKINNLVLTSIDDVSKSAYLNLKIRAEKLKAEMAQKIGKSKQKDKNKK